MSVASSSQEDMLEHGPRGAADRALEAVVGRGDHLQQAGLAHHDVVARLEADLARVGEADAARQVVARLVGHHAAPERVRHAVERGEEGQGVRRWPQDLRCEILLRAFTTSF